MGIVISGNKNLKFIKAVYYQPVQPIPDKYLTIEAIEDDTYIRFNVYTEGQVWYSFDKRKWTEVVYTYHEYYDEWYDEYLDEWIEEYWEEYTQENEFPILSAGQKLYIKGTLGQSYSISDGIGHFGIYQPYNLSGNCNSLVFCDDADKIFDLNQVSVPWYLYSGLFSDEGVINISPDFLPATTLTLSCYSYMFSCCTSLTTAPNLPATELANQCYSSMFAYSGLHNYPKLPATTLAYDCYAYMFGNCIPYINEGDYDSEEEFLAAMMNIVKNLKIELPAEELADGCYAGMFSVSIISEITASFITEPGYDNIGGWLSGQDDLYEMYQAFGITPKLILRDDIEWDPENYRDGDIFPYTWEIEKVSLFTPVECTSLSITANDVPWDKTNTTIYYTAIVNGYDKDGNWVIGKEIEGEAVSDPFEQNLTDNTISRMISFTYLNKTATITINHMIEECLSLSITANDVPWDKTNTTIYYTAIVNGYDKDGNWVIGKEIKGEAISDPFEQNLTDNTISRMISFTYLNKTATITILQSKHIKNYFTIEALVNGLTAKLSTNSCEYSLDGMTWINLPANTNTPAINSGEKIYFRGNLTPDSSVGIGTFTISKKCNVSGNIMSLLFGDDFEGQTDLSGYDYAFYRLFYYCWTIIDASQLKLPATTLADYCYYSMFNDCTSLVTAPELPATTLADYCYCSMFTLCNSLATVPELPATTLASHCYRGMFHYCSSLVTAPELPATTLAEYCYKGMFFGCTSLVTAPELPATTLAEYCYHTMFYGCTKLNYIKALFTTTPGSTYTGNWVSGVSSTGTFVKSKDATWNVNGIDGIPSGWTVQTI